MFCVSAGHYAAACGDHIRAGGLFSQVAGDEAVSPQTRRLALLHACLAEANGQHPNWMGRAHALLASCTQQEQGQGAESHLEK